MATIKFNPTTPGRRFYSVNDFAEVTTDKPHKALTKGMKRSSGRNNKGRITIWWRGGGHKRRYRIIDFKRNKRDVPARVASIEYDPIRSSHIALLHYHDGEKRYILAPEGLQVGDTLMAGQQAEINPGNALPLKNIPLGTQVHNVELKPGKGGQMARAAGSGCQILAKEGRYVHLRVPSGEIRMVLNDCYATVGQVGNQEHENVSLGKAGRSRWLGRRSHVRGVAMNPVDHPLGGGEGKSAGGRHPVTPWGKPTKGYKTRKKRNQSGRLIVRRRK